MEITPVLPNARQKFQLQHGIPGIFHGISIFLLLFHYFLQKPCWETLLYELPDDIAQDKVVSIVLLDMMLNADAMLCHNRSVQLSKMPVEGDRMCVQS
jgi:hypothetical protein